MSLQVYETTYEETVTVAGSSANLKVYEITYDETLTVAGTISGEVVSYEIVFSDQGPEGPQGPQGPQGPVGPQGTTDWNDLTNVPATFPPSSHTHSLADITNAGTAASVDADQNLNINSDVSFNSLDLVNDLEITDYTKGVILKSPNSARWRLTIDNDGTLTITAL